MNEQPIDHFWCKVIKMETSLGSSKFSTLSLLVKKREKFPMSNPLLKAVCNSRSDYYNHVLKEKIKIQRVHQEEHTVRELPVTLEIATTFFLHYLW